MVVHALNLDLGMLSDELQIPLRTLEAWKRKADASVISSVQAKALSRYLYEQLLMQILPDIINSIADGDGNSIFKKSDKNGGVVDIYERYLDMIDTPGLKESLGLFLFSQKDVKQYMYPLFKRFQHKPDNMGMGDFLSDCYMGYLENIVPIQSERIAVWTLFEERGEYTVNIFPFSSAYFKKHKDEKGKMVIDRDLQREDYTIRVPFRDMSWSSAPLKFGRPLVKYEYAPDPMDRISQVQGDDDTDVPINYVRDDDLKRHANNYSQNLTYFDGQAISLLHVPVFVGSRYGYLPLASILTENLFTKDAEGKKPASPSDFWGDKRIRTLTAWADLLRELLLPFVVALDPWEVRASGKE